MVLSVRSSLVVSPPDSTFEEACKLADRVILVRKASQTGGLLTGIKVARYPIVVTLDTDLENPPELIPISSKVFVSRGLDLLVASHRVIP